MTPVETQNLLDAVKSMWRHEPVVQHLADEVRRLHIVNDLMAAEIAALHNAPFAEPDDVTDVWTCNDPRPTVPYPPTALASNETP